jgi:hypothetical protein
MYQPSVMLLAAPENTATNTAVNKHIIGILINIFNAK